MLALLAVAAFQLISLQSLYRDPSAIEEGNQLVRLRQNVGNTRMVETQIEITEQLSAAHSRGNRRQGTVTPKYQTESSDRRNYLHLFTTKQQPLASKLMALSLNSAIQIIDSRQKEKMHLNENKRYVFFISNAMMQRTGIDALAIGDQHSIHHLAKFLEKFPSYDAATCLLDSKKPFLLRQVNNTWCRFSRRESTLIIRDTGRWFDNISFPNGPFQCCSIVKGPFLMQKETFMRLGWKSRFGRASIFDFFLRSEGKLKIARLSDCVLSDDLGITDRGTEEETHDFPDYSQFADEHGILRIVMEDRIEWTMCVADGKFCMEKPFTPPKVLPQAGMPLCCSYALDRMLRDIVWAINKVGLKYRIIYGTLLGAIRNKAIIPWTHDVDIALNKSKLVMPNWNEKLQEALQGRYFVGISFMDVPRAIPLIPTYIDVNTTSFFDGLDDISGGKLFSKDILMAMKTRHTIGDYWRDRGYIDFYEAPEIWWNGSSVITINGQKYISIRDIDYELTNWYGKDYMKPVLRGSWTGLSDAI